jgi:hypothetical protein
MKTPPAHVVDASDHDAQQTLDSLDAQFRLRFNRQLHRYELWRRLLGESGPEWDFVLRLEQGAAPSEWLLGVLRRRDARYVGPVEAARVAIAEMDAHNEALEREKRAKKREEIAAIAHEYAPIFGRELAADPLFAKPFRIGGPAPAEAA